VSCACSFFHTHLAADCDKLARHGHLAFIWPQKLLKTRSWGVVCCLCSFSRLISSSESFRSLFRASPDKAIVGVVVTPLLAFGLRDTQAQSHRGVCGRGVFEESKISLFPCCPASPSSHPRAPNSQPTSGGAASGSKSQTETSGRQADFRPAVPYAIPRLPY